MTTTDSKNNNSVNKKNTGIDMLDNLSPEDRKLAIENSKKQWQSLTPEQKVMHLDLYYAMLQQEQREHGGMITNIDAVNEFLSKDLPAAQAAAVKEAEHNGRLDIEADLKRRRFGVHTFEIILIDEDKGDSIP
jgi:hypothetical protein